MTHPYSSAVPVMLVVTTLMAACAGRLADHDAALNIGLKRFLGNAAPVSVGTVGEGIFNQTLDHFATDDAGATLWPQRFQYNLSYHRSGGPVFLLLGGEGPANPEWLAADTAIMLYALRFGAGVYQLEHRFYGQSQPFGDLSLEHLAYLSSRQALADAENFVKSYVLAKHGASTTVVSFGGSYSGALSAWLRLVYPDTIHAAVSTSSPILAVEDFSAYQQVVQDSLLTAPDGSACVDRVRGATRRFQALALTLVGRGVLERAFNTCAPIGNSSAELANLMSTLAGSFDGVVQYNNDNRGFEHPGAPAPPNITGVCAVVNAGIDADVAYTRAQQLMTDFKDQCMDVSYVGMVEQMRNTSLASDAAGGSRQWVYQTCKEFGYFQSSDASGETQPFGTLFPVGFSSQQCADIYGVQPSAVSDAIAATNAFYGGLAYNATRVIFVNGDIDPWHKLSLPPRAPGVDGISSVLISGTAHCANMYPPGPNDLPGLSAARASIEAALEKWLAGR